jgi:hypothetical protein
MTPPESCGEFDERLRVWPHSSGGLREWLQGLSGIEDCIAGGLLHARQSEDWTMFERYVGAAFHNPSRAYTDVLCEVLSLREELNNEDIVDALAEIADAKAVDCLRDAFLWKPP